jgi:predicted nucleic acid-binding protein
MIHLDANILILAAQRNSEVQAVLSQALHDGENFSASATAWTEFLNGPVSLQNKEDADFMIEGRVLPYGRAEALIAARLFNETHRKRGSMADCMIAATAIQAGALLSTHNRKDFAAFVPFGLRLA